MYRNHIKKERRSSPDDGYKQQHNPLQEIWKEKAAPGRKASSSKIQGSGYASSKSQKSLKANTAV